MAKKREELLEVTIENEELLDSETELELTELDNFTKSVSKKFKTITDANQARFTIDSYYQMQDMRINCANKIRADIKGLDNPSPNPQENQEKFDILFYQYKMYENAEITGMITAFGTILDAVQAMQLGAADFITKPFDGATLLRTIQRNAGTE